MILIPACASSSPAFLEMYSAYKLSKQGDNIQPWHTPLPIWNQSVVSCPVLTVASWPAYRFLRRQVRWSGFRISWGIFQFVVIYTVKGFGVINKADVFLELSCFFDDRTYLLAMYKSSLEGNSSFCLYPEQLTPALRGELTPPLADSCWVIISQEEAVDWMNQTSRRCGGICSMFAEPAGL